MCSTGANGRLLSLVLTRDPLPSSLLVQRCSGEELIGQVGELSPSVSVGAFPAELQGLSEGFSRPQLASAGSGHAPAAVLPRPSCAQPWPFVLLAAAGALLAAISPASVWVCQCPGSWMVEGSQVEG